MTANALAIGMPFKPTILSGDGGLNAVLGEDLVAYYDAVKQGGNPQLITWSDDPAQGNWTFQGTTATPGQPDPEGGTNAWRLTKIALSDRYAVCPVHDVTGTPITICFAIKAGTTDTLVARLRDTGADVSCTSRILSGPGNMSDGVWQTLTNLSSSEWTFVEIVADAAFPGSGSPVLWFYPNKNGVTTDDVTIFRPTVQIGVSDNLLRKSEATVPALVTSLKDYSENGYHQPITTPGIVYVANAGDGLPAWWFDGAAATDGVTAGAEVLPLHKWTCHLADAATIGVNAYIESALTTGRYLNKTSGEVIRGYWGAAWDTEATVKDVFQWVHGYFSATETLMALDGVGVTVATAQTNTTLHSIRTGSDNLGANNFTGYIRSTVTAKTALTSEQIEEVDNFFNDYSNGVKPGTPQALVAEYDALKQGGNPQLLKWSDDPTQAPWTAIGGASVTLGQEDPDDGGSSAWLLSTDGTAATDRIEYTDVAVVGGKKLVLALLRSVPGTSDADLMFRVSNITNPAFLNITTSVLSGPGTATPGPATTTVVQGLSLTEWTYVEFTIAGVAAGEDHAYRFHPGNNAVAEVSSVFVFRPTLQFGNGDGQVYPSTGTVPALVTELRDFSGNGYHQPMSGVIYVAAADDDQPAWWCDGVANTSSGVVTDNVLLPGYKWGCFSYDLATVGAASQVEAGSGAAGWELFKHTNENMIAAAGGQSQQDGPVNHGLFDWVRAKYDAVDTSIWLNDSAGTTGGTAVTPLKGIRTGSNAFSSVRMHGYIRATRTYQGDLTAEEIQVVDDYFASLSAGDTPTLPGGVLLDTNFKSPDAVVDTAEVTSDQLVTSQGQWLINYEGGADTDRKASIENEYLRYWVLNAAIPTGGPNKARIQVDGPDGIMGYRLETRMRLAPDMEFYRTMPGANSWFTVQETYKNRFTGTSPDQYRTTVDIGKQAGDGLFITASGLSGTQGDWTGEWGEAALAFPLPIDTWFDMDIESWQEGFKLWLDGTLYINIVAPQYVVTPVPFSQHSAAKIYCDVTVPDYVRGQGGMVEIHWDRLKVIDLV